MDMMRFVKCKQCGCDIYHQYSPIESLNCKGGEDKYLSELQHYPDGNCNTSIYLTCPNGHIDKYFCKIEISIDGWKDCPVEGCTNKVCLSLNSDKCFVHTKGHRWWKLIKIWFKNLFN